MFDSSPKLVLADGTPNPGNILRPGQYGRVRIQTSFKKNALLVPQTAVKELQGGYQVALLSKDNKAIIRPVKAGEKVGTMWVIDDGLKADDKVLVEGV